MSPLLAGFIRVCLVGIHPDPCHPVFRSLVVAPGPLSAHVSDRVFISFPKLEALFRSEGKGRLSSVLSWLGLVRRLSEAYPRILGQLQLTDFINGLLPAYIVTASPFADARADEMAADLVSQISDRQPVSSFDHLSAVANICDVSAQLRKDAASIWLRLEEPMRLQYELAFLVLVQLPSACIDLCVGAEFVQQASDDETFSSRATSRADEAERVLLTTWQAEKSPSTTVHTWLKRPDFKALMTRLAKPSPLGQHAMKRNPKLWALLLHGNVPFKKLPHDLPGFKMAHRTNSSGQRYWHLVLSPRVNKRALCHIACLLPNTCKIDAKHMTTNLFHLLERVYYRDYTKWLPDTCFSSSSAKAAIDHATLLFRHFPIGSFANTYIIFWLSSFSQPDLHPAIQGVLKSGALQQPTSKQHAFFKEFSTLLRRYQTGLYGLKLSDTDVARFSYVELSFGRANMKTDWAKEIRNRCTATYHLRCDTEDSDTTAWREDTVAHPELDPRFQEMMEEEMTRILVDVIPKRPKQESYLHFLERRHEWITSGSAAGTSVTVKGKVYRANKRVWGETIDAQVEAAKLFNSKPEEHSTASEKYENGKARAIFGTHTDHFSISSYATDGFEENLKDAEGFEKGFAGADLYRCEAFRCGQTAEPHVHCCMLDFADFNVQHTPDVQALFFKVCKLIGQARRYHPDWVRAHQWLADSKFNSTMTFPPHGDAKEAVTKLAVQGMPSGTKTTDLMNTVCNRAYLAVAARLVKERYDLVPTQKYSVHQGDDIWISTTNSLWCVAMYYTMNNMGMILNPIKQMFGQGRGEYLRVLYSGGKAQGYLARALVNYLLRPLQGTASQPPPAELSAGMDTIHTLLRRGADPVPVCILYQDLLCRAGKVRGFPKDPKPVKIPLTYIHTPTALGGFGCLPPFASNPPGQELPPFPALRFDLEPEIQKLPSRMTDDWVMSLSRSKDVPTYIDADSLRRMARLSNYSEVIVASSSLRIFKRFKSDVVELLATLSLPKRTKQLIMDLSGANIIGHVSTLMFDIHQAMLLSHNVHFGPLTQYVHTDRTNDYFRALARYNPILEAVEDSILDRVQSMLSASAFKSLSTTKTALGMNTEQALQFIATEAHKKGQRHHLATRFLLKLASEHKSVELNHYLNCSYGLMQHLKSVVNPNVLLTCISIGKARMHGCVERGPTSTLTNLTLQSSFVALNHLLSLLLLQNQPGPVLY